jgi:hypothetical protein
MMDTIYKRYLIAKEEHPKLQGKYSIYYDLDVCITRASTVKEAKKIIDNRIKQP